MKTAIKSNWLIIVLMALVVCFTCVGIASLRVERGTTTSTPVLAEVSDANPTTDAHPLANIELEGTELSEEFKMENGASVRVNKQTSGLRFTVYYGDELDTALNTNYPRDAYDYQLYFEFCKVGDDNALTYWSSTTLYSAEDAENNGIDKDDSNAYQKYTVAFNFGSLTDEQFNEAKSWQINAKALVVIKDKTSDDTFYFYAAENDNTRSMEAVANAAIQAGEKPEYINQLTGKPFVDMTQVVNYEEKGLIESGQYENPNRTVTIPSVQNVTGIYLGAKKLQNTEYTKTETSIDLTETVLSGLVQGKDYVVAIFANDGKIYNTPFKYVDKILTKSSDFSLFAGDGKTKGQVIDGYYIMANDIELDGTWAGNCFPSNGTSNPQVFKGVFDGNGHVAEIALKGFGVFGSTSDAVIKNVAFIVKQIQTDNEYGRASILAHKMNNTEVIDCYFEYDIDETQTINVGWAGTGYSSGVGLYNWASGSAYVKFTNVIFDSSKLQLSNTDTETEKKAYAYGSLVSVPNYAKTEYKPDESSNTYLITTNKYVGYLAKLSGAAPNGTVSSTAITGVASVWYASNDKDAYDADKSSTSVKKLVTGIERYDSFDGMPNAKKPGNEKKYSTFNTDVWNFYKGYPQFKSIVEKETNENTKFFIGNSETTTANIVIGQETTAYATYTASDETVTKYQPTSLVSSDEEIITCGDKGKITAKKDGNATVTATYKINNVEIIVTYTVNVSIPTYAGKVMYSSSDVKIYFPEFKEGEVVSLVDEENSETVYYDGTTVSNIDANNDRVLVTKNAIVTLEDGTQYRIPLNVYTKVLTKADDLKVLIDTTATAYKGVNGYYILGNDIIVPSTYKGVANVNSYFVGTLDGDGHVIYNLKTGSGGLFSGINARGKMINLGITVDSTFSATNLIANKIGGTIGTNCTFNTISSDLSKVFLIDNCYFDINVAWAGPKSSLFLYTNFPRGLNITNTIFDLAEGVKSVHTSDDTGYGLIYQNTLKLYTSEIETSTGAKYRYLGTGTTIWEFFRNSYYINKDFGIISGYRTDDVHTAFIAENDTAKYNDTDFATIYNTGRGLVKGIERYDSFDVMPKNNVIGNENKYSTFNTDVWNFYKGYPQFKSIVEKDAKENTKFFIGNSETTTADLLIGQETTVYATYTASDETVTSYEPTNLVSSDEEIITCGDKGKITAKKDGNATVTATYKINGVEIIVTYTVNVSIPTYAGKVMYSSLDGEIFFPEFKEGEVVSLVDEENSETVYYNGSVVVDNIPTIDSATPNEIVTKTAIVTLADGTKYIIPLNVYTKVLTKADDLKSLINQTTFTNSGNYVAVKGYYILANDITVTDAYEPVTNAISYFVGVLDGNGHAIYNLRTSANGLFNGINYGGQMKNLAITVDTAFSAQALLAYKIGGTIGKNCTYNSIQSDLSKVFLIDNVYIDVNASWNGKGSILFGSTPSRGLNITNTIFDLADGLNAIHTGDGAGRGFIYESIYAVSDEIDGYRYMGNDTTMYELYSNSYFINKDYGLLASYNTGGVELALVAENDKDRCTSLQTTYIDGCGLVKGIERYDSFDAMPKKNVTGNENKYSTFNTDIWDFTNNYPRFRAIVEKETEGIASQTEFYLGGGSNATSSVIYSSGENNSVDVYATYGGETYYPTLEVISGKSVTVNDYTITAVPLMLGESVVSATYIINGYKIVREYTISVKGINFITNSSSDYAIVIPNTLNLNDTSALAYAVNDLHDYVNYATGGSVDLAVVKASDFNAQTYPRYISVGKTGLLTQDITSVTSTLGEDGLFYFSDGDDIYFTGATNYGVANGIYDFLRTYFGFEAVTDNVVIYNQNVSDVSFASLYKIDIPDIPERQVNGVNAQTRARLGVRNGYLGYNLGSLMKEGTNTYEIPLFHNTLDYIPYATHQAEHGAYWYATNDNTTIPSGGPKDICYTAHGDANQYQAMVNQFVSRLQAMFIQRYLKGYTWNAVAISTEDNNTVCKCDACATAKTLYGGYNSGAPIKFINDVKAGIDAWLETDGSNYKFDNFKLIFFAYQSFINAPVKLDETTGKYVPVHEDVVLDDGVIVALATSASSGLSPYYGIDHEKNAKGKATIEKWASISKHINLWTYQANFEMFLFFSDTFALFNERGHEFFKENNVNAWVNQNHNANQTGWLALKEYVSAKLMWDTSADLEQIFDTYFSAVYGNASAKMKELFNLQRTAFQDALNSFTTAKPDESVAGYDLSLNGHYNDVDLWTLVNGYREAITLVTKGSDEYYQIIKEAIAPYYQLLTNHNRYGDLYSGTSVQNSIKMEGDELTAILNLKAEFKSFVEEYEAKCGRLYRTEHTADVSSDMLYNSLGYKYIHNGPVYSLITCSIGGYDTGNRVDDAKKTLSVGNFDIGWAYGYDDYSKLNYKNVKIEVLSGEDVVSITVGVKADETTITHVNNGYISSTNAYSNRNAFGTLNCIKAGTAVIRLYYDLDGVTYKYDLTITVK